MIDAAFLNALALPPLAALARVVGFVVSAPPFSGQFAPKSVKIGFALALWIATTEPASSNAIGDSWIAAGVCELLGGLLCGLTVQIVFSAIDVIGELISNGMGLSFPGAFDPMAGEDAGPASGLTQLAGIAIFVAGGGLEGATAYLLQSRGVAASASAASLPQLAHGALTLLSSAMALGAQASIAIWGSLLLANGLLLVSARLAGGLNLMNSGLPLLLALGLGLLCFLLIPAVEHVWANVPDMGPALVRPPK